MDRVKSPMDLVKGPMDMHRYMRLLPASVPLSIARGCKRGGMWNKIRRLLVPSLSQAAQAVSKETCHPCV
jgi:hypothetical protein